MVLLSIAVKWVKLAAQELTSEHSTRKRATDIYLLFLCMQQKAVGTTSVMWFMCVIAEVRTIMTQGFTANRPLTF